MMQVLSSTWALMLGMMLLMLGNGIQSTLLGVRGVPGTPARLAEHCTGPNRSVLTDIL